MAYVPYSIERIKRKLVIVGDSGVGKTSLVMRYATGKPPSQNKPFIYEDYFVTEMMGDEAVELRVVDTAYVSQRKSGYSGAHIVLMAFSVDSRESFENITQRWFAEVQQYAPTATIILLGLKRDTRGDPVVIERMKERDEKFVDVREALLLSSALCARTYIECSSYVGVNVRKVFEEAISGVVEKYIKDNSQSSPSSSSLNWINGKRASSLCGGVVGFFGLRQTSNNNNNNTGTRRRTGTNNHNNNRSINNLLSQHEFESREDVNGTKHLKGQYSEIMEIRDYSFAYNINKAHYLRQPNTS
ncbi:9103_t:CDS:2, partial [Ambispora gerdemannii]